MGVEFAKTMNADGEFPAEEIYPYHIMLKTIILNGVRKEKNNMKIKYKFKKGEIAGFKDGNKTIFVKIIDIKHNNWELGILENKLIKLKK